MKNIREYLKENEESMLEVLAKLVSFPSVNETNSAYPFGEANALCLDYALKLCEDLKMKTKNLDYYIGYGEIGAGKELIGVIGHLDVVPVGGNWNTDPFKMEIKDNKAYGRGTSDDKGPLVSALFAFKYLLDNEVELNKRLRIVFGCNEESGFKCVEHYVEKEGHFDYGFTPDGPFPCCFGESGIIKLQFSAPNKVFEKISGGMASNVVPDNCEMTLDAKDIDQEELIEYLEISGIKEYALVEEAGKLRFQVSGKAAHASTPEEGVNAISFALTALVKGGLNDPAIMEFAGKINTEYNGESCGVNLQDEYRELTLNVGKIWLKDDNINFEVDIRCPFTFENAEVIDSLSKEFINWQVAALSDSPGLYQPEDSPFVKILVDTYKEVTGKDDKPLTMGGGTYARGVNNTLAFGADYQDDENTNIHDANEFIKIENLLQNTEIYITALLKLLEL